MTESWILDGVRNVFGVIDNIIFSLIAIVYDIILQITKIEIFSPDSKSVQDITGRIYGLLAIIMLFKVSFSLISYLVNPDGMTDKSKGAQKIIANVLIVLMLIIITPTAFTKLYQAQNAILEDNIIPKFILGRPEETLEGNKSYYMSSKCEEEGFNMSSTNTDGNFISLLIFRPFYQIESSRGNSRDDIASYCEIGTNGNAQVALYTLNLSILNSAPNGIKDTYVIDYKFFLSTITGIIVLLIFISFCFDIAVRCIKLGFLQIIAPVPIISYIDPKSGKDGMFKKWLKEVGKTWASLFIRLVGLFFAVSIIELIVNQNIFAQVGSHKLWVELFVIIGAFIFAKQLPKLIENILGIKLDSHLILNPIKKIKEEALGGKTISSVPGKALGTTTGMIGGAIAGHIAGQQVGMAKRGTIIGAVGGMQNGFKEGKFSFTKGMQEQYKNLTGNEMARLSVSKLLVHDAAELEVKKIKDNLSLAYANLNDRRSALNDSERMSSELALTLSNKGYNVHDISGTQNQVNHNIADQTAKIEELRKNSASEIDKYQDSINKFNQEMERYNSAKKILSEPSSSVIDPKTGRSIDAPKRLDAENIIKQFENNEGAYLKQIQLDRDRAEESHRRYHQDISRAEQVLEGYKEDYKFLERYVSNKNYEDEIRTEISAIEKDIETFKSQKGQTERFGQLDRSPQGDYRKAEANQRKMANKHGIKPR